MNTGFKLDASKFNHYLHENKGWQQMLKIQIKEIPVLKKMLSTATQEDDRATAGNMHFSQQLVQQLKEMESLNKEIIQQQKRLNHDLSHETESAYDINTFCSEDILRERIRVIEKKYIELKSDFMKYLSALI